MAGAHAAGHVSSHFQTNYATESMLDFKELAKDGQDFELLIREILFREGFHVAWSGRGADGVRFALGSPAIYYGESGVLHASDVPLSKRAHVQAKNKQSSELGLLLARHCCVNDSVRHAVHSSATSTSSMGRQAPVMNDR